MASYRTIFEKDLRHRLSLKGTAHQTEEAVLLKTFQYYDLNNTGSVNCVEFIKVIEKLGIQIFNEKDFKDLFAYYDIDNDGKINYKEFIGMIFNNQTATTRGNTRGESISQIQKLLFDRGTGSILGLARYFTSIDTEGSRSVDFNEFQQVLRESRIDLKEEDYLDSFEYFDKQRTGLISYDEFLQGLRGPLNSFRRPIIAQAFRNIDSEGVGSIYVDQIKKTFNARGHPDLKLGKRSQDNVLLQFINCVDNYVTYIGGLDDQMMQISDFEDLYSFISPTFESDNFFDLYMTNVWLPAKKTRSNVLPSAQSQKYNQASPFSQRLSTPPKGEIQFNPSQFGDSPPQPSHKSYHDMEKSALQPQATPSNRSVRSEQERQYTNPSFTRKEDLISLTSRGTRGFLGLQRQLRIMDLDYDRKVNFAEFKQALKDYKLTFTDDELQTLFNFLDVEGEGKAAVDDICMAITGELNGFRKDLVVKAFDKLDLDQDDFILLQDIKNSYTAKYHPEVRNGNKTEDEILGEFLETFELHHNLKVGIREKRVSKGEFVEYYENIGASIAEDQIFEQIIVHGYQLYQEHQNYQSHAPNKELQSKYNKSAKEEYRSPTIINAPFGTSNIPTDYATFNRPKTSSSTNKAEYYDLPAGQPSWPGFSYARPMGNQVSNESEELFRSLKAKMHSRGIRGVIAIYQAFQGYDEKNIGKVTLGEFIKTCRDFRFAFSDEEVKKVFSLFDPDTQGTLNYQHFLDNIKGGPLNSQRLEIIQRAFNQLDKTKQGIIDIHDVQGTYNARYHPDVRSGKKSEDEILGEFLDTFEIHHAIYTGDLQNQDREIRWEEFLDYYHFVSCTIESDAHFILVLRNSWSLEITPSQK